MIFSNAPWSPSGYGTQAAQLGRTLRRHGHEVAFAAYWGLHGTSIAWEGFPVYPGSGEDAYARDVLPGHYAHFKADLLITLMDMWVFEPAHLQGMNVAHWMPVDCTPLGARDRKSLAGGGQPVAFSRFGEKQLQDAGYDALYAPHALDCQLWSPLADRDKARTHLGFDGKFVIGVNAANQDPERKGYFEQLSAFAEFSKRHDDARMLIHTRANTAQGVEINEIIAQLGIADKAVPGDQYAIAAGMIGEAQMASWHGVMDLLSNCALAEGFGLSVLQSQATGVPVVVTDFSAMTELCGVGWRVKGQRKWNWGHNARWCVPSIAGITAAYEKAYLHARNPEMREKARRFALRYDADLVYRKYWAPILEQLAPGSRSRKSALQRTVWSPVMFRDEIDMLDMRLAETKGLIDRHIIAESELTHRGVAKPLHYLRALPQGRFLDYAGHVDYVTPALDATAEPWANEHAQRDAAWPVIEAGASDSDIVLICDVDEIPSRSLLERARAGQLPEVCSVRMRTTLFAVDWEVPQEAIPPTCVVATAGYIRRNGGSLAAIRDKRAEYPVVLDGGWHFSWTGGPDAHRAKMETATCHTEVLGTPEGDLIASGERWRAAADGGGLPVVPVTVDETWPAWIRDRRCPENWFRPASAAVAPTPGGTVIMLTAWRRPYYFGPVLESWARAEGIENIARLVIALGPTDRYDEQMDLIRRMTPQFPCPVEVVMQSPEAVASPSAHRAIAEGINGIFADPGVDFVVFGEEDLLVSSDVLAYMGWAREKFAADKQVLCVCAHNQGGSGWDPPVPPEETAADQHAVRLLPYFSGWVNGFWRDRWEQVLEPSWDWDATSGNRGFDSGWDWNIQLRVIPAGGYLCVVPDASRSQNTGQHEGGYADPEKYHETISGSFRPVRESGGYELVTSC